jgi:hypothetical protein
MFQQRSISLDNLISILREKIVLFLLQPLEILWKKGVFVSPGSNHLSLDLCCQKLSSLSKI